MSSEAVYIPRSEATFYDQNVNRLHIHARNTVSSQTIETNVLFQDFALISPPRLIQLPTYTPDTDGSAPSSETFIDLEATGWILGVTMRATVSAQRGQTYVQANVTQGSTSTIVKPLLSRYVTPLKLAQYPAADSVEDAETRPAAFLTTSETNPAAGANVEITIPANRVVYPIVLKIEYEWGSGGGSPNFIINDGSDNIFETDRIGVTGDNDGTFYLMWGAGQKSSAFTAGNNIHVSLPPMTLNAGFIIKSNNLTGDDDLGEPKFFFESLIRPD